ncbi:CinA family protein [Agromyces larvae]|uniref:Nicotinamide-nucleotide amidohydrolase family protein n=1 Tax=Agromyces larvae TaxID=2929802 RepID=A0ABY4C0P7_9MICO|nr:nicotinamide-nucleotide amidohydrolase family protein [Agromyces larvae]UOE44754.1 nicotinamide-nucleotide amidohydrolase family protein [Agromyces larvae]
MSAASAVESIGAAERDPTARLVAALTRRGLRVAIAESLTGGALAAELVRIPGASQTLSGAVVAYDTAVKHTVLGVEADLLAREGAVHADVARQMALGAARVLAVGGRPADVAIATTGVAGPDPQDGRPPGTVYVAVLAGGETSVTELRLDGDRAAIRAETVRAAVAACLDALDELPVRAAE